MSARVFEAGADVGGTWYWNRYPGARCDIPTPDYTYSFDPELESEWTWSRRSTPDPAGDPQLRAARRRQVLHSARHPVLDQHPVGSVGRRGRATRWRVGTDHGDEVSCRFFVMASGCLSLPKSPDIEGSDRFAGAVYFTSRWPHEGVDFTGQRVAVIGTGSSGIQSIPIIAEQAAQLTVFQRTPNFSIPAHNGPAPAETLAALHADRDTYREGAKWSRGGIPGDPVEFGALQLSDEERREHLEAAWATGELFGIIGVFNDVLLNPAANEIVADFIRDKIRSIVRDPETAESLCPTDHPFATKRPCLDTNYFATFNLPHVRLIDLHKHRSAPSPNPVSTPLTSSSSSTRSSMRPGSTP